MSGYLVTNGRGSRGAGRDRIAPFFSGLLSPSRSRRPPRPAERRMPEASERRLEVRQRVEGKRVDDVGGGEAGVPLADDHAYLTGFGLWSAAGFRQTTGSRGSSSRRCSISRTRNSLTEPPLSRPRITHARCSLS